MAQPAPLPATFLAARDEERRILLLRYDCESSASTSQRAARMDDGGVRAYRELCDGKRRRRGHREFAWTRLNQQGTGLVAAGAEPE